MDVINIYTIILSSLLTLFLCIFLSYISPSLNLLDYPNKRKIHSVPVPLVGGISIISSFIIFTFFLDADVTFKFVIYSSVIVLLFGLIDDIFDIGITIRLIAQFVACLLIIETGLKIVDLGYYDFLPYFSLGFFSILVTFICVVGLTNAFNFIDGIDGFCSSQVIISLLSLIFLSTNIVEANIINLILILIFCILIGFFLNLGILFNKIFLGDSGSTTLGFLVAWFLIYFSFKNFIHEALIIWCVTLPVYDMLRVVFQRLYQRRNPFKPDRSHVHHIFLSLGYSNKSILFITIIYSLISSLLGNIIFNILGADYNIIIYIIWFAIYFILINFLISKKIN